MALALAGWRQRKRSCGLALDQLLPVCFGSPAPPLNSLPDRVAKSAFVPESGRMKLDAADVTAVVESAGFMLSFVSEVLPVQVVACDTKPMFPAVASNLAVQASGGEATGTYVGPFDLIGRIFATTAQPWVEFNRIDMAIDCKQTSVSRTLGLNGPTMRGYMRNARMVMAAARKAGTQVGDCGVVAFLLHRPRGLSRAGQLLDESFGFVAIKTDVLLACR